MSSSISPPASTIVSTPTDTKPVFSKTRMEAALCH